MVINAEDDKYSLFKQFSFTLKNKLFVMDDVNKNCEVFDNVCRKFVALKPKLIITYNKCLEIGNKI